jgi:hypothetical protein
MTVYGPCLGTSAAAATLLMHKLDYANVSKGYKHGDSRHGVTVRGCDGPRRRGR